MSDQEIAQIGRLLATALRRRAHDRDADSIKDVARLHTELCAAVRQEHAEQHEQEEPGDGVHPDGPQQ